MGLKSQGHESLETSKFPKLSDCAHFHYEFVYLKHTHIQLFESKKNTRREEFGSSPCWPIEVSNQNECWVIWRSYSDFFTLDNQIHCCVYDRRTSKLPKLPKSFTSIQDDVQTLIEEYIRILQGLSWDLLCCGPCLNWFELDNKGNQIVALCDKSDINTPAIAGAIAIQDYQAQTKDEISLKSGDMVSVINMPPKEDSVWWKGKRSFQVGYFPSYCVTVIREDVPDCVMPYLNAFHNKPRKTSSLYNKNGKLKAFICNFLETRPSRRRLKQAGILKERVFGCDLGEHLLNTSNDIPVVLKICAEFIEKMGIVDGVYRLSGVSSNIQRLRNCFDEDGCPDLCHDDQVMKDIHCVTSVLKMYFRELPNPLLTYQLYDDFIAAIRAPEDQRMTAMKEVVRMLPPPHFRTLQYLCFHLKRISEHSNQTNMSAKNLAIVWAPNLLRCEGYERGGISTLQDVGLQAVITEFLICCADWLLTDVDTGLWLSDNKPSCFGSPVKLLSLREAQRAKSCRMEGMDVCESSITGEEMPVTYHTIINIGSNPRNNYRLRRSWRNLWGCRSSHKLKLNPQVSHRLKHQVNCPSHPLWPVKSADSLMSLQAVQGSLDKKAVPFNHSRTASHDSYFHRPTVKTCTVLNSQVQRFPHGALSSYQKSKHSQLEYPSLKVTKSLEAIMQLKSRDEKLCQSVPGSLVVSNSVCDFTDLHSIIQSFPRPSLFPNIPSSLAEDGPGLIMAVDTCKDLPVDSRGVEEDASQQGECLLTSEHPLQEQEDRSITGISESDRTVNNDLLADSFYVGGCVTATKDSEIFLNEGIYDVPTSLSISCPGRSDNVSFQPSQSSESVLNTVWEKQGAFSLAGCDVEKEEPIDSSPGCTSKTNSGIYLTSGSEDEDWDKPRIMAVHPKKSSVRSVKDSDVPIPPSVNLPFRNLMDIVSSCEKCPTQRTQPEGTDLGDSGAVSSSQGEMYGNSSSSTLTSAQRMYLGSSGEDHPVLSHNEQVMDTSLSSQGEQGNTFLESQTSLLLQPIIFEPQHDQDMKEAYKNQFFSPQGTPEQGNAMHDVQSTDKSSAEIQNMKDTRMQGDLDTKEVSFEVEEEVQDALFGMKDAPDTQDVSFELKDIQDTQDVSFELKDIQDIQDVSFELKDIQDTLNASWRLKDIQDEHNVSLRLKDIQDTRNVSLGLKDIQDTQNVSLGLKDVQGIHKDSIGIEDLQDTKDTSFDMKGIEDVSFGIRVIQDTKDTSFGMEDMQSTKDDSFRMQGIQDTTDVFRRRQSVQDRKNNSLQMGDVQDSKDVSFEALKIHEMDNSPVRFPERTTLAREDSPSAGLTDYEGIGYPLEHPSGTGGIFSESPLKLICPKKAYTPSDDNLKNRSSLDYYEAYLSEAHNVSKSLSDRDSLSTSAVMTDSSKGFDRENVKLVSVDDLENCDILDLSSVGALSENGNLSGERFSFGEGQTYERPISDLLESANNLKVVHGARETGYEPIEGQGSNAKRLRIEQYKEKRREFLREKFKMENFMNSDGDELLLRLKSRVSSNRKLYCDCLTDCGHDKVSSSDHSHANRSQLSKTQLESVVTTVSDLQAELRRTSREGSSVGWYNLSGDVVASHRNTHSNRQDPWDKKVKAKESSLLADSKPKSSSELLKIKLKKTDSIGVRCSTPASSDLQRASLTKSLPTTPVDLKEAEVWPKLNLKPVRWSSVDSSNSVMNKHGKGSAKSGHVLELCKKFSAAEAPSSQRVRTSGRQLGPAHGKYSCGFGERASLYDKV